MPAPIPVHLLPHDPLWSELAAAETGRLTQALGPVVTRVHHVGSTAVPGIRAKPILDLIPVVTSHEAFDALRPVVESLGYAWWGENGLPGRRFCTLDDATTGERRVHLHAYEAGSPEITRHVAFREYLCAHRVVARGYDLEKVRCQQLNPDDSHEYSRCKHAWIERIEADALAWFAGR